MSPSPETSHTGRLGIRVGQGIDVHRFGGPGPLLLCGVVVDPARGVEATSDGDVAFHALVDGILGAGGLGDLGMHFPSSDPRWHGSESRELLAHAVELLRHAGLQVVNVDVTIVAQSIEVAPHREAMRAATAEALGVARGAVSVKATTTDRLGMIGRDEGVAAFAVVLVEPLS